MLLGVCPHEGYRSATPTCTVLFSSVIPVCCGRLPVKRSSPVVRKFSTTTVGGMLGQG